MKNFIEELEQYLNQNSNGINKNMENKEINNKKLITEYRDKLNIEKRKILEKYADETKDIGTMYYIYDKEGENYLATICDESRSHEIIEINQNDILEQCTINSILRKKDNKYIIDEEISIKINSEISNKYDELLEKQNQILESRRQEEHIYEFVEKSEDSIFLIDNTLNSSEVFEEIKFEEDIFENAKEGDLFKYSNGMYSKIS